MRPFRYWATCSPELRLRFEPRSTKLDRREALASEDPIVRELWLKPFPSEASTYRKDFGNMAPWFFEKPTGSSILDGTGFDERVRIELMRTNCHPQLYWLVQMAWSGLAVFDGMYQQVRVQPESVPAAALHPRADGLSTMLAGIARLKEEVALVLENVDRHTIALALIGEPWEVVKVYAAAYAPFPRRLFWETYDAGTKLRDSLLVATRERLQSRLEMLMRRDYPAMLQIDDPDVTADQFQQMAPFANLLLAAFERAENSKFLGELDGETTDLLARAFGAEIGQSIGQNHFDRVFGEFLYKISYSARGNLVRLSEAELEALNQLDQLVYRLFKEPS